MNPIGKLHKCITIFGLPIKCVCWSDYGCSCFYPRKQWGKHFCFITTNRPAAVGQPIKRSASQNSTAQGSPNAELRVQHVCKLNLTTVHPDSFTDCPDNSARLLLLVQMLLFSVDASFMDNPGNFFMTGRWIYRDVHILPNLFISTR